MDIDFTAQVLTAGYARNVGIYDLESEKRDRIATPSAGGHDGAIAAMTYDTHSRCVADSPAGCGALFCGVRFPSSGWLTNAGALLAR